MGGEGGVMSWTEFEIVLWVALRLAGLAALLYFIFRYAIRKG